MPFLDKAAQSIYTKEYWRVRRLANPEQVTAIRRAQKTRYMKHPEHKVRAREYQRRYAGLPQPTRPEPKNCENCERSSKKALSLDHCHITGKFRGWLCHRCNTAAGLLNDSPELILKLYNYLIGNKS
jgi:hypothetical protein